MGGCGSSIGGPYFCVDFVLGVAGIPIGPRAESSARHLFPLISAKR